MDPVLRRYRIAGVAATAVIVLSIPIYLGARSLRPPRTAPAAEPQYVGSEKCKTCHEKAYVGWKGSNHAQAMQAARDGTVLGDFSGATLVHRGKTWRFFRRGERFMDLGWPKKAKSIQSAVCPRLQPAMGWVLRSVWRRRWQLPPPHSPTISRR